MNKLIILSTSTLMLGALNISSALGADDAKEHHAKHNGYAMAGRNFLASQTDVAPVTQEQYRTECGSCHFAYQPGLLPARSWKLIMSKLDNHFGDNAELSSDVAQQLNTYLNANAADTTQYGRSPGIARSIPATAVPLRITETTYFMRKHHELPRSVVQDNPKVKSFSACQACHTKAETGSYNEDEVQISGVGRWED